MRKKLVLHTRAFEGQNPDKCIVLKHLNSVLRCCVHGIRGIIELHHSQKKKDTELSLGKYPKVQK